MVGNIEGLSGAQPVFTKAEFLDKGKGQPLGTVEIGGVKYTAYSLIKKGSEVVKLTESEKEHRFDVLKYQINKNQDKLKKVDFSKTAFSNKGIIKFEGEKKSAAAEKVEKAFVNVFRSTPLQSENWKEKEIKALHEFQTFVSKEHPMEKLIETNDHKDFEAFVKAVNKHAKNSVETESYAVAAGSFVFQSKEAMIHAYCDYEIYLRGRDSGIGQNLKEPLTEAIVTDDLKKGTFLHRKELSEKKVEELLGGLEMSARVSEEYQDYSYSFKKGEISFKMEHKFAPNSDLNGLEYKYIDVDGKEQNRKIKGCFNSSINRDSINSHLPRVVADKNNCDNSICYAGRIKSSHTAKEIVSMMYRYENEHDKKGVSETAGKKTFTFSVHSLLTEFQGNEKKMMMEEMTALAALEKNGLEIDGETVVIVPIHMNTGINLLHTLDQLKWGKMLDRKVNEYAFEKIKSLVENEISKFEKDPCKLFNKKMLIFLRDKYEKMLVKKGKYSNEDALLVIALINHFLDIPVLTHCKSSVDRTSQTIALYSLLAQWIKLHPKFKETVEALEENDEKGFDRLFKDMQQDDDFKELFYLNWIGGSKTPEYSRGARSFKLESVGISISTLKRWLPKRFFSSFGSLEQEKLQKEGQGIEQIESIFFKKGSFLGLPLKAAKEKLSKVKEDQFRPIFKKPNKAEVKRLKKVFKKTNKPNIPFLKTKKKKKKGK